MILLPLIENQRNATSHSYGAFGNPSKGRLLMMDLSKWAPTGFATWIFERDKSPGVSNVRMNRRYAHEVASKLIEEKRQGPKDGTSRKDLFSLLSSSCVPFTKLDVWCDIQFF